MKGKFAAKKVKKSHYCSAWVFIPAMVLFNELLLHFWTAEVIMPGRLLTVILFSLAFGGALGALACLLKPKAQKWTAVGIAILVSVLSLMEYFLHDAYQTFMPRASSLAHRLSAMFRSGVE